jgi:hypothetical protein
VFDSGEAVDCEGWLERFDFEVEKGGINQFRLRRELGISVTRMPVNKAGKDVLEITFSDGEHTSKEKGNVKGGARYVLLSLTVAQPDRCYSAPTSLRRMARFPA